MQATLDRRTFVAGAAGSAAVSTLMGIGLTRAQAEEAAAANGGQTPSFLIPPDPVSAEKTADYDVVVVGAGFSGLNCAFSAAQNGASVCLIERLDQVIGRGGSTFVINSKLMDEKGYHYTTGTCAPEHDDEKKFDIGRVFKRMMGYHSYRIDGKKWLLHAHKSEEAMNWMIDNMTTTSKVGGYDLTPVMEHWYADPEGINGEFPGTHEFLDGPNGSGPAANPQQDVCENLLFYCQDAGVDVHFGTVAQQLVKDGSGRVVGVVCQDPDGTLTQYNGAKGRRHVHRRHRHQPGDEGDAHPLDEGHRRRHLGRHRPQDVLLGRGGHRPQWHPRPHGVLLPVALHNQAGSRLPRPHGQLRRRALHQRGQRHLARRPVPHA